MLNKKQTTIAALAIMLVGLLVVNIAMAATPAAVTAQQPPADVEKLMPQIPKTIEEAETAVYPVRGRFLMWTHDGVHVMWGRYGNGIFVGTDNLGKRCWGIYGNGIFAGFYDDEFFWGKYQAGSWKAIGLFGLRYSYGRYVLFPSPVLTAAQP